MQQQACCLDVAAAVTDEAVTCELSAQLLFTIVSFMESVS